MPACRRTDARATPTDMSVKRCAAARKREWLSAARKLRSSEGRAWAYAHGISPVAVQMDAACLHAGGQMHSDANRHEREAMRSNARTRMAVSGPEAAKQRGTKKTAARTAGSCYQEGILLLF